MERLVSRSSYDGSHGQCSAGWLEDCREQPEHLRKHISKAYKPWRKLLYTLSEGLICFSMIFPSGDVVRVSRELYHMYSYNVFGFFAMTWS